MVYHLALYLDANKPLSKQHDSNPLPVMLVSFVLISFADYHNPHNDSACVKVEDTSKGRAARHSRYMDNCWPDDRNTKCGGPRFLWTHWALCVCVATWHLNLRGYIIALNRVLD
jgi:hypothetical protein